MPTYEFRCPNGHEFERIYRTISGAPSEVACPECNAIAPRIMSAGAGLLFKGSGFYLTDYGKNAHRKSGPPSSEKKSEGGKPESGKSEGGMTEGGKAEGGKAEGGKAEGGKAETPSSKPDAKSSTESKPKSKPE
jgi:putative FmdB family regulatory protein